MIATPRSITAMFAFLRHAAEQRAQDEEAREVERQAAVAACEAAQRPTAPREPPTEEPAA